MGRIVTALAFTPDGHLAIVGDFSGGLSVLDLAAARIVLTMAGDDSQTLNVNFGADGSLQILTALNNGITLWKSSARYRIRALSWRRTYAGGC